MKRVLLKIFGRKWVSQKEHDGGKMNASRWEGNRNTDNVLRRNLLLLKVQGIFHHRLREGLHRILIFERKAS